MTKGIENTCNFTKYYTKFDKKFINLLIEIFS